MKEAEIFENYMNRLSEGTWALPDTPEAYEKLQQLMASELIVGADAMNATEQLYDLVGDDELFDILNDLADKSEGRANCWDDSDVQRRLAELGVQTPQSTEAAPADVPQDTAPPAVPPVAEGLGDTITRGIRRAANAIIPGAEKDAGDYGAGKWDKNTNTNRNNFINWITLNQLDYYEDELLGYFDKFVDGAGSEYKAGEQAVNTWKTRMKRDGESVRKPEDVAEGDDFGPAAGPNFGPADPYRNPKNLAGPLGPLDPDWQNYKTPNLDRLAADSQSLDKMMGKGFSAQFTDANVLPQSFDARGQTKYVDRTAPGVINKIKDKLGLDMPNPAYGPRPDERERLAKRYPAPTKESAELARMLEHAGVPLREGVLTDSTGSTMEHIKDRFRRDIKDFTETGDMSDDLYDALYDYYFDDMPYAVRKAKSNHEDQYQWISNRFADNLGINENLISPMIMPVSEGSCNMTMEGEYCPEHGLMECGGMYEDGGAVGMPYSMGEELNEIGDTPAGQAALQRYGNKAHDQVAAHWKQVHNKSHLPTDEKMAKRNAGTVAAGNRIHGFGIAKNQQDKVTDRFKYRDAVGLTHVYQKNNPLEQGLGEGNDDPINSNSAMTGSYYEGKETDIQEGDALLARIKSLALLR
jgi:hypothetical protein